MSNNLRAIIQYIMRIFVICAGVITIIASGGGDGGGDSDNNYYDDGANQTGSAPVISNLTCSPVSAIRGSGEGRILVNFSYEFVDNDGNISTSTFSVFDSNNNLLFTSTDTIEGISGVKSGMIEGGIYADTSVAGEYTFQIYVTDETNLKSNIVEAIFTVTDDLSNRRPIADAGINRSAEINTEVVLDGGNSSDPDGDPLTYTWSIVSIPDGSIITLSDPNAVDPSFTPDMIGTYLFSLVVSDGQEYSETDTVTITVYTDFNMLGFLVVDAEYSEEMEKIIMISSGPNQLHIYDPVTHSDSTVSLPLTPLCVSVGPDGTYAAVGYDAWTSYIDLYTETIEKTITVSAEALDVVLAGNGYIYVFPTEDQWERIRCINIDTEAETSHTGNSIYAGTKAKLHPNGSAIYGADNGLSPSDIEKYSITAGTAVYLYDSPYHGDYYMGGDLWISEDGLRIFTRGGNVFRSSDVEEDDMIYNGSLSEVLMVKHLDHCATSSMIAVIPDNTYSTDDEDTEIQIYSYEYLGYEESIQLPYFINNGNSYAGHGSFVFISNDGSTYFVIVTADISSGLLYDQAVVTY